MTTNIEHTESHQDADKEKKHKFNINFQVGAKSTWIKGLYILFFIIASYIAVFITFFVMLFQFLSELIFKKPNEHLQNFGETLGLYACSLIRFITGSTDEMPFPFKPWPKSGSCKDAHKH